MVFKLFPREAEAGLLSLSCRSSDLSRLACAFPPRIVCAGSGSGVQASPVAVSSPHRATRMFLRVVVCHREARRRETHSSGTVQDFHLIPSSSASSPVLYLDVAEQDGAKVSYFDIQTKKEAD